MDKAGSSPENKKLGLAFANAVTVVVPCVKPSSYTIGRTGEHSVFDLFTRCFRRSTRDNSRSGLSSFEMNNELEKDGFSRVRVRKVRKEGDQDHGEPSSFRYSSRRWRDPDDVHDLAHLQSVWPLVNKEAKVPCSFAVLLECLRGAVASCRQLESDRKKGKGRRDEITHNLQSPSQSVAGSDCIGDRSDHKTGVGDRDLDSDDTHGVESSARLSPQTVATEDLAPSVLADERKPQVPGLDERRVSTEYRAADDLEKLLMADSDRQVDLSPQGLMTLLADERGSQP